jgi:hypothetical protein
LVNAGARALEEHGRDHTNGWDDIARIVLGAALPLLDATDMVMLLADQQFRDT